MAYGGVFVVPFISLLYNRCRVTGGGWVYAAEQLFFSHGGFFGVMGTTVEQLA
jgi:hypothetical protein